MQTIIAVFKNWQDAMKVVGDLSNNLQIPNKDISLVVSDKTGQSQVVKTPDTAETVSTGAGSGAITGGIVGTIAGLVVANGVLPGLGTLFVAGPLATALGLTGAAATTAAGALTGAAAGGVLGALGGLGISAEEAQVYENRVKQGDIVIAALVNDEQITKANAIFSSNNAEELHAYAV